MRDLDEIIMPGITHWQSPNFFAYFPANASGPAILGDLLSSGLGVQGMSWTTSPACTELETHVLDWLVAMLDLPEGDALFEQLLRRADADQILKGIFEVRQGPHASNQPQNDKTRRADPQPQEDGLEELLPWRQAGKHAAVTKGQCDDRRKSDHALLVEEPGQGDPGRRDIVRGADLAEHAHDGIAEDGIHGREVELLAPARAGARTGRRRRHLRRGHRGHRTSRPRCGRCRR